VQALRERLRHGLRLYATDDVIADHLRRSTSEDTPFLSEFAAMDMDQRWVSGCGCGPKSTADRRSLAAVSCY
jgi:hypothetical protein